ncbi:indolepyruvate ferredoxin oxidoreductase subunit alpha [Massiliimalia massiliensis]|uniref:indolepyruvate ferredoxin oxidoreductase subunit alpha n=1 Tax=Massiliimalia massiliensis TaxID=1852384 RepID=UPI001E3AF4F1|nr:indolepyruvate ferredoxin oxidoreductase subunit alpha [Massiliimalia massiliensis]
MEKKLMIGNEAAARGLYEGGCRVASSYPGTPSTEITEFLAAYDDIYSEWAPNEKVAMEVAVGAAISGARSFCAMKHVGLNVAADPLFTASYTGINAGMVIAVADDPGMHSSQNEQDSRHYAKAAKVMMLEPSDSAECLSFAKAAYELSEQFDTPVILRLTTRIAHSRSLVATGERNDIGVKEYVKDPQKYVMMPAMAKGRHIVVEDRIAKQVEWAETTPMNRTEYHDTKIGIITSGICYQYAKEALGEKASYLKLGCVYPLPVKLIQEFAAKCDQVYVVEELDPFLEEHCKQIGISVIGKEAFTLQGEYFQSLVKKVILGEETKSISTDLDIPGRPPVLCAGCPHRGLFYALKKQKVTVSGDIGCYTLGALQPLGMIDTCVCMGASVSGLHGRNKADAENAKKSVAVIGDSTFMHSGVTGLINIAYNQSNSTVIILDNSITGMTGHQENPTTGKTIKGDPTTAVSLEKLAQAVGIDRVRVVDPYNLKETEEAIREELAAEEPSVIISRRPCALLKYVKHNPPLKVNADKCTGCKMCMKIGCPAISFKNGKSTIDFTQCVGCNVCTQLCRFNAIEEGK